MTPTTIHIDGTKYIREDAVAPPTSENYVVLRARNAGVHAGTLAFRNDGIIRLENCRRLWRWTSHSALSDMAMNGPCTDAGSDNRYELVVPKIDFFEADVCELIYCTEKAIKGIAAIPVWDARA